MRDSFGGPVGTRLVNVNHHCTPDELNPVVHRVGFPPRGAQVIPATILGLFVNATCTRMVSYDVFNLRGWWMKDAERVWKVRNVPWSFELFVSRMYIKYTRTRILIRDFSGFESCRIFKSTVRYWVGKSGNNFKRRNKRKENENLFVKSFFFRNFLKMN